MTALATAVLEAPSLRAQYAERITAAWHKSREKFIALGNALIEAKQKLEHGEFTDMIENDLPFSPWTARQFIRIASDPRNVARATVLPDTARAMDELRRLNDEQFEAAVGTGRIHGNLTVVEAKEIVRDYIFVASKPHRPEAAKRYPQPFQPTGTGATTWSQAVWLLIKQRIALGLSQADVDARAGWSDGQCGKYEIPHADDGRVPTVDALCEWMQVLQVVMQFEPA
jgi:hypothetical protein